MAPFGRYSDTKLTPVGIPPRLSGLAGHHRIGDAIGVRLVGVTGHANAALELDAAALLDHMRRLVCGGVEAWRPAKRDVTADCVRLRTERTGRNARSPVGVRAHTGHVVHTEGRLDRAEVRQRATRPSDTGGSGFMHALAGRGRRSSGARSPRDAPRN